MEHASSGTWADDGEYYNQAQKTDINSPNYGESLSGPSFIDTERLEDKHLDSS